MENEKPNYILMVMHHEPFEDPRVKWVAELSSSFMTVEVIGIVYEQGQKSIPSDNENIVLKRLKITPSFFDLIFINVRRAVTLTREFFKRLRPEYQDNQDVSLDTKQRNRNPDKRLANTSNTSVFNRLKMYVISVPKFMRLMQIFNNELDGYSIDKNHPPKLIICHDLFVLESAIRLKNEFGCPLIYDSHEYWPEAQELNNPVLKKYIISREKNLIKHADSVVSVTPQLSEIMQQTYHVTRPIVVPNASPIHKSFSMQTKPFESPVIFLLQGRISAGRGVDTLLDLWEHVNDPRCVLMIRSPLNSYGETLKERYKTLINTGHVVFADPVTESELIDSAKEAHIGIIPYIGPSLNHIYACPNKLSQYMQAGLAILYCSDMQFVGQKVNEFQCGWAYDPYDVTAFVATVKGIIENPSIIQEYQKNALEAAQTEYNWEIQSQAYKDTIEELLAL